MLFQLPAYGLFRAAERAVGDNATNRAREPAPGGVKDGGAAKGDPVQPDASAQLALGKLRPTADVAALTEAHCHHLAAASAVAALVHHEQAETQLQIVLRREGKIQLAAGAVAVDEDGRIPAGPPEQPRPEWEALRGAYPDLLPGQGAQPFDALGDLRGIGRPARICRGLRDGKVHTVLASAHIVSQHSAGAG